MLSAKDLNAYLFLGHNEFLVLTVLIDLKLSDTFFHGGQEIFTGDFFLWLDTAYRVVVTGYRYYSINIQVFIVSSQFLSFLFTDNFKNLSFL